MTVWLWFVSCMSHMYRYIALSPLLDSSLHQRTEDALMLPFLSTSSIHSPVNIHPSIHPSIQLSISLSGHLSVSCLSLLWSLLRMCFILSSLLTRHWSTPCISVWQLLYTHMHTQTQTSTHAANHTIDWHNRLKSNRLTFWEICVCFQCCSQWYICSWRQALVSLA